MLLDRGADLAHDLGVDAEQVVAAHAGLARDAGGDDDDVGAGDRRVVGAAVDRGVEILDRRGLRDIERLALRHAVDHVEQHDVAELLQADQQRQRAADIARADERDLLTGHPQSHLQPGACRAESTPRCSHNLLCPTLFSTQEQVW